MIRRALLLFLSTAALATAQTGFPTNAPFASVLGQGTLDTNNPNYPGNLPLSPPTSSGFSQVDGLAIDSATGKLFVVDSLNHRILRYSSEQSLLTGGQPEVVLGQADFNSNSANRNLVDPGNMTANSLAFPIGATVDSSGNLWVVDWGNTRVLRFENASTLQSGANAVQTIGNPFTRPESSLITLSASQGVPYDVQVDAQGNLFIAQGLRVAIFLNAAAKGNQPAADIILGQPSPTSENLPVDLSDPSQPVDTAILRGSFHIALDPAGNLYVTRGRAVGFGVVVFRYDNPTQKTTGAVADGFFAPGLYFAALNNPATSTPRFLEATPISGLRWDSVQNRLAIFGGGQVLFFSSASTLSGGPLIPAGWIGGDYPFTGPTDSTNSFSGTFRNPMAFTPGSLFVADVNRVVRIARTSGGGGGGGPVADRGKINLVVEGEGVVPGRLANANLIFGRNYKLSARPKRGQIFVGWEINGQRVPGNDPRLTFTMEANLEIRALFAPNPFLGNSASFATLISDDAAFASGDYDRFIGTHGMVQTVITPNGRYKSYTSTVRRNRILTGLMIADPTTGDAAQTPQLTFFPSPSSNSWLVELSYSISAPEDAELELFSQDFDSTFPALLTVPVSRTPGPMANRRFNVLLIPDDPSLGYGYLTISVDRFGLYATVAGRTPDGGRFAQRQILHLQQGNFVIPISTGTGSRGSLLTGAIRIDQGNPDLVEGVLRYGRAPQSRPAPFGGAAVVEFTLVGAPPPAPNISPVSGNASPGNFLFSLEGPDAGFSLAGTWAPQSQPVFQQNTDAFFQPSFNRFTGLLNANGVFYSSPRNLPVQVVAVTFDRPLTLPNAEVVRGGGFFLTTGGSGSVTITETP